MSQLLDTFWTAAWFSLLGMVAFLVIAGLVWTVTKYPVWIVIATAGFAAINWEFPQPPALSQALGFSIYADDAMLFIMTAAAIVNVVNYKQGQRAHLAPPILFTLAVLISLVNGVGTLGPGLSVVEARPALIAVVTLVWAASVDWRPHIKNSSLRLTIAFSALSLCLVAAAHVAIRGLGDAASFVITSTGLEQTSRPLTAPQAAFLTCCVFYLIGTADRNNRLALLIGLSAALVVSISGQRTALICLLVGSVILALRAPTKRLTKAVVRIVVVGIGIVALMFLLNVQGGLASLTDERTYDDRIGGWQSLVSAALEKGFYVIVLGEPFGSGFGRLNGSGQWVEYAPHNWYVTIFLRAGLVGLVALLVLTAWLVSQGARARAPLWALPTMCALAIYAWSYSWTWFLTLFVGMALAIARQSEVRDASTPREDFVVDRKFVER